MVTAATPLAPSLKAFRAAILDFVADPFYRPETESVRYFADGLLVLKQGKVKALGDYETLRHQYASVPLTAYPNHLIMPGLIDIHIHFPQTEMIAAYGEQLLQWLSEYTFPIEGKFRNQAYAKEIATFFLDQLLRNGTTTALVMAAVYPEATEIFFEAASRRNLRMIAGKVMMDRNAPDFLMDTAISSYEDSKRLIQTWHKQGRLLYAVTPRFAITSTDEQLQFAGKLLQEFPDVYFHTHLSENVDEVALVQKLFPNSTGYLNVYDQAGLVRNRSVFAHGVQLRDDEFHRLAAADAAIAFCPTSNLFLGSGLFKLNQAKSKTHPVKVGLATDVGAGTSFSLLQTAGEAYKVAQLQKHQLSPFQAFFLVTLGAARALSLEDKIGNFDIGKEADFIVLDPKSTPLLALRNAGATPTGLAKLADRIFSLMMMGDDRAVHATYILGELAYAASSPSHQPQ